MAEVVTLGECMAVLYPSAPVSLEQAAMLHIDCAGAETNLAIGLRRLGHSVRFISHVGADPFGQRIHATLAEEGVDTSYLLTDTTAPTGVFFREWLPDGARRVFYYRAGSAASHLSPQDLQVEMFHGARIVHLTGITPALSASCAAAVARAIELARIVGALVSFDPNYRARLWDMRTAQATLLPLMSQTDILLMGHEDAHAILGLTDDDAILARGVELGARAIVLKRAERGACALAGSTRVDVLAEVSGAAIDPVGAGDGFNAGFLAGWLRGYALEDALRLGARIGAAAVATLGDYAGYPRLL
ncbi:MAG: sugar kinase [Chloroflexota bacterium]|nr:sugar kinase [Chloroflexota bacterium]